MDYRDSLIQSISDMSKDLNGVRDRRAWHDRPIRELEQAFEAYKHHLAEELRRETELQDMCRGKFERHISLAYDLGASDRATAIRWIIEPDIDANRQSRFSTEMSWDAFRDGDQATFYDVETALLNWGLSMSYINELMSCLKKGV